MHTTLLIRAGWVSLCLLVFATASFSQPAPNDPATANPSPTPIRIIYSGKFLGYLRVPSVQPINPTLIGTCPDASGKDSQAASSFLAGPANPKERAKFDSAIRVSTGDNFAPQLEARVLGVAQGASSGKYMPGNKELYNWDQKQKQWVPIEQQPSDLKKLLARGGGTIPTDNVACFLSAAKYIAVVPGKHDFYFGAERVRQLARFMAGLNQVNYRPVQMLGANLVIKTAPVAPPSSILPKVKSKWPDESSVQNLREGKPIYPWFSSAVRIKVPAPAREEVQTALKIWFQNNPSADRAQVEAFLSGQVNGSSGDEKDDWTNLHDAVKHLASIWVCRANDFNEVTVDACEHGQKVTEVGISGDDTGITYSASIERDQTLPTGRDGHYAKFEPGKSYGLCQQHDPNAGKGDIEKNCLAFPVYRPFFNFPRSVPLTGTNYVDPDPFVVIRDTDPKREVAIFGAVDPNIREEVGLLNFSWDNQDAQLKTVISAEDPAEALNQQLDYFNAWNNDRTGHQFEGLKILLAQMSPQRARVLAARLKKFQLVVTAADEEQGTSETTLSTDWSKDNPAGAFVAVPLPYVEASAQKNKLEGTIHLGLVEASRTGPDSWNVSGTPLKRIDLPEIKSPAAAPFWSDVAATLQKCLSNGYSLKYDQTPERLRALTLCAIRERLGADVALIQRRDFFSGPNEGGDTPDDFQQVLDRLVWKGDLLTLMYVPGAALKKALDQSKKFDDEDKNSLSLADERLRGLVYLGVSKPDQEYLINEAPLDEKRIYAVATTDYIGAGDTGYPDLAAAALDPKTLPSQYPERLESISSVVCRKLYPTAANVRCLPEIRRKDYLDEIAVSAPASPRPPSLASKLHALLPFKFPSGDAELKTNAAALERGAEHRPIWALALRNFSLGFLSLSNNLTDAQVGQKFAGVSTSGVTAKKTRNVTVGLDTRLSRSTHRNEFFVAMGIDYSQQSTGDVNPRISQLKNRVSGDVGLVWNIKGGRAKDHVGLAFALHTEAPLERPFTNFTLGTSDTLKITQNRSVLLLQRTGLRWQNGTNFFEVGGQAGREINALGGYRFNTNGSTFDCLPTAAQTLAACITKFSTPPMTGITKNSVATAIVQDRTRAGVYWKYGLSIPFGSKVKYELNQGENQEADFFFNFHQDNAADTRFLDRSKQSLKFTIFPSLSIGPSLQLLLYRNKVNHDFLFQKQFGFEANFSFNLSNHRERMVQIKHKP